jgi:hypothetical protein
MEREILKTILDGKLNFSEFFIKHMKKGDRAFLVDKKFISSWEEYSKSKSKYLFILQYIKAHILLTHILYL